MSKLMKHVKTNFHENGKLIIVTSLLFSCTFYVFGMFDIYLHNYSSLWFDIWHVMSIAIPAFLLSFLLFVIIGCLLPGAIGSYYPAVLFALGLALYIQGNFLNNDYGLLDGTNIEWNNYTGRGALSIAVWMGCLMVTLILFHFYKKYSNKVIITTCIAIIATQLVTLGIEYSMNQKVLQAKSCASNVLTSEKIYSVSQERNFIIFVVDALDATYFSDFLNENPDYREKLADFTYFDNTLSASNHTMTSIPFMLTGRNYQNGEPYNQYLSESFSDSPFLNSLSVLGYDVGVYSDSKIIGLSEIINNQKKSDRIRTSSYSDLAGLYSKFTAFRYAPQFLKEYFWFYGNDFNKYQDNNVFKQDDVIFYQLLQKNGLIADNKQPVFRFYHLVGIHQPLTMDENIQRVDKTTMPQQLEGSLKIVLGYIDEMKKLGIYNNASIIIVADHGLLDLRTNPAFLIKTSNDNHPFVVDSRPISFLANLQPTFLSIIENKDNVNNGISVFDVPKEAVIERKTLIPVSTIHDVGQYYFPLFEFSTKGFAKDSNALIFTGKVFMPPKSEDIDIAVYNLGTILDARDFHNYSDWGFLGKNDVYSNGSASTMFLKLNKLPEGNLKLTININRTVLWPGEITLYVNQTPLGTKRMSLSKGSLSFIIPNEMIEDTMLGLRFEYTISDKDNIKLGTDVYSFHWESIEIHETDEKSEENPQDDIGFVIQLLPLGLEEESINGSSATLYKNDVMSGYYMTMPKGDYRIVLEGENLEYASFYIAGNVNSEEIKPKLSAVVDDSQKRIFDFSIETWTFNTNFVLYNTSEQDVYLRSMILKER